MEPSLPKGRRLVALVAVIASAASIVTAAGSTLVTGLATGGDPTRPTWWAKYQVVSAPGFMPSGDGARTKSVSVGANIDARNEPAPRARRRSGSTQATQARPWPGRTKSIACPCAPSSPATAARSGVVSICPCPQPE